MGSPMGYMPAMGMPGAYMPRGPNVPYPPQGAVGARPLAPPAGPPASPAAPPPAKSIARFAIVDPNTKEEVKIEKKPEPREEARAPDAASRDRGRRCRRAHAPVPSRLSARRDVRCGPREDERARPRRIPRRGPRRAWRLKRTHAMAATMAQAAISPPMPPGARAVPSPNTSRPGSMGQQRPAVAAAPPPKPADLEDAMKGLSVEEKAPAKASVPAVPAVAPPPPPAGPPPAEKEKEEEEEAEEGEAAPAPAEEEAPVDMSGWTPPAEGGPAAGTATPGSGKCVYTVDFLRAFEKGPQCQRARGSRGARRRRLLAAHRVHPRPG